MVDHLPATAVVTTVPPLAAGSPDPLDLDAVEQLQANERDRLALVRSRAEKWIGAIAALSTVLAGVLVIKGPGDATKVILGWRIAVAAALGCALALLALATYHAYRAAFGAPRSLTEIQPIPLTGLHDRLAAARRTAADNALSDLTFAVRAAVTAVAVIAVAVAVTWFAPTSDQQAASLCMYRNGDVVARFGGDSVDVESVSAGTTIAPCR